MKSADTQLSPIEVVKDSVCRLLRIESRSTQSDNNKSDVTKPANWFEQIHGNADVDLDIPNEES